MLFRLLSSLGIALMLFTATLAGAEDDRLAGYTADLSAAGYAVNLEAQVVSHAGLSAKGSIVTANKSGALAKVELLEYPNQEALAREWIVTDQLAPRPKTATSDFTGKVLIWREDSILVLDFDPPNDPGTVQTVAFIFLGRKGMSFEGAPVKIIPPGTGNGGIR